MRQRLQLHYRGVLALLVQNPVCTRTRYWTGCIARNRTVRVQYQSVPLVSVEFVDLKRRRKHGVYISFPGVPFSLSFTVTDCLLLALTNLSRARSSQRVHHMKHCSPHFDVFGRELAVGHGSGLGSVPRELVATRQLKKLGFAAQKQAREVTLPKQWNAVPRFHTNADLLRSRRDEKIRLSRNFGEVKKEREPPFSFSSGSAPNQSVNLRKAKKVRRAPYYTKLGEEALPQRDHSTPAPKTKKDLLRTRAKTMHDNLESGKAKYDERARSLREQHSNLPSRLLGASKTQSTVRFPTTWTLPSTAHLFLPFSSPSPSPTML